MRQSQAHIALCHCCTEPLSGGETEPVQVCRQGPPSEGSGPQYLSDLIPSLVPSSQSQWPSFLLYIPSKLLLQSLCLHWPLSKHSSPSILWVHSLTLVLYANLTEKLCPGHPVSPTSISFFPSFLPFLVFLLST